MKPACTKKPAAPRKRRPVSVAVRINPEDAEFLDGLWTKSGLRGAVLQRSSLVSWMIHMALGEYVRTGYFGGCAWHADDFPQELIEARKAGLPYSPTQGQKIIPFPGDD